MELLFFVLQQLVLSRRAFAYFIPWHIRFGWIGLKIFILEGVRAIKLWITQLNCNLIPKKSLYYHPTSWASDPNSDNGWLASLAALHFYLLSWNLKSFLTHQVKSQHLAPFSH